jgi:hypothetical protein
MNGFLLGLATAAIVLVPMLQDRDRQLADANDRNRSLLDEVDELDEELRIRDTVERSRFARWN